MTCGLSLQDQVVRAGAEAAPGNKIEKSFIMGFKVVAFYNDFLENFHQMSIEQHHKCILVIRLWEN